MVTTDPPLLMAAATGGGTWSASCGACIDATTGAFDPSIAGVGTHNICYDIGVAPCDAQDCIAMTVSSILSAEVSSVDIDCVDGKVNFEWETSQEMDCSHFLMVSYDS